MRSVGTYPCSGIQKGYHRPYFPALYRVSLADGREGEVVDITADGDYIVRIEGDGIEECVSIQDIKEAHNCE